MKKNIIVAAFATVAALSMSNVFAAAGTINFTGEILDTACDVSVESQNQSLELGHFYKAEFSGTGAKTSAKDFNIVLKNCPGAVSSAVVRFDGTPAGQNNDLLAIDSNVAGAATGVAINLMTADKTHLPLHGSNTYNYSLSSTADNTLQFFAQYESTADVVTAGPANAVANFSVIYN